MIKSSNDRGRKPSDDHLSPTGEVLDLSILNLEIPHQDLVLCQGPQIGGFGDIPRELGWHGSHPEGIDRTPEAECSSQFVFVNPKEDSDSKSEF